MQIKAKPPFPPTFSKRANPRIPSCALAVGSLTHAAQTSPVPLRRPRENPARFYPARRRNTSDPGPKSRSPVLIQKKWGAPVVCNDGVTIAKEFDLKDPEENLGAQVLRQAAEKTGELVGDGTSTATIIAHAIFADGVRNVVAGASAVDLKKGLRESGQKRNRSLARNGTPGSDSERRRRRLPAYRRTMMRRSANSSQMRWKKSAARA